MKRFVLVAALAGILVVAVSAAAFAAPPTPQSGAAFGPGGGIHTPGTGLANGTAVNGTAQGFGPMWQRQQGQATGGMGAGLGLGMRGGAAWAGQPDEVQTLLGMTGDEIQAERLTGKSLAQIAAEKDKTKDQLVSTILSAKKAILEEQVAAGKLTQAQADAVYGNMQQQVPVMVDPTDFWPGCGTAGGQTTGTRMGMTLAPALRFGASAGVGGRWNR